MPWPPRTQADAYDITYAEAEIVRQQLAGKPVSVFHRNLNAAVGTIDRGYWDARGNLCVEFTLNSSGTGQMMRRDILCGLKRGLSLQHNWQTLEVKEVSLTDIGARDGTWIEQMQLPGDKQEFVALPSRPRPPGMSETPRDPITGRFMSASAAPAAANTGVAPMDTGPAPPPPVAQQQQQQASTAAAAAAAPAAGSEGPVDPLLSILTNESIPMEQRKLLMENFKSQRAAQVQAERQLQEVQAQAERERQETQAKLLESQKQKQDMMQLYVDTVSRVAAMGGQDFSSVGPRVQEAAAKNDFAGFAAATADVMVKASGTIERLLESRKRTMEQSVTTSQLVEDFNQFNAMLRRPPAATPAAAAAAAMQQQQPVFAPAMVAASGPVPGRAPMQQQQQQQQPQFRTGRDMIPADLRQIWDSYMATQDTSVDVAGTAARAAAVQARGM